MYVVNQITVGTDEARFERELVVQDRFTATVDVRVVLWWVSHWNVGTDRASTNEQLLACGRWKKQDGEWSTVDARSPITESELPPAVLEALLQAKGEL
jgi:hypothetical protein